MIKKLFFALPGPTPLRVALAAVIIIVALIGLLLLYDWVGNSLLDTGGSIG